MGRARHLSRPLRSRAYGRADIRPRHPLAARHHPAARRHAALPTAPHPLHQVLWPRECGHALARPRGRKAPLPGGGDRFPDLRQQPRDPRAERRRDARARRRREHHEWFPAHHVGRCPHTPPPALRRRPRLRAVRQGLDRARLPLGGARADRVQHRRPAARLHVHEARRLHRQRPHVGDLRAPRAPARRRRRAAGGDPPSARRGARQGAPVPGRGRPRPRSLPPRRHAPRDRDELLSHPAEALGAGELCRRRRRARRAVRRGGRLHRARGGGAAAHRRGARTHAAPSHRRLRPLHGVRARGAARALPLRRRERHLGDAPGRAHGHTGGGALRADGAPALRPAGRPPHRPLPRPLLQPLPHELQPQGEPLPRPGLHARHPARGGARGDRDPLPRGDGYAA